MSGGYFEYKQFHLRDIADSVEQIINDGGKISSLRDDYNTIFSKETISMFCEAYIQLRKAEIFAHRIDWLLSCDDTEETFHQRLQEDLENLKKELEGSWN